MISKYVNCRKLRGETCLQKMSDLLEEWLIEEPSFSCCEVTMFGSFLVKEGRKIHKQYGVMFRGNVHMLIHSFCSNRDNKQYEN